MSQRQVACYLALFRGPDSQIIFQTAMDGGLRESPLRGLTWRFFLGALHGPDTGWSSLIAEQQIDFDVRCHRHCVDPSAMADSEDVDLSIANPLSTSEDSPFNKNSALREQVDQDLARLYPGDTFFERPDVQRVMHRILLVWACDHPDISYRQGMHELLAPLLLANWLEAEESASAGFGAAGGEENPVRLLLAALLRVENVEVATWAAFDRLMRATSIYFDPGTRLPPSSSPPTTPLLRRCSYIHDERLRIADPALHARMVVLGVQPQLYLLRWLRLLFGREFHVEDAAVVWDALFAYGFEYGGEEGAAARAARAREDPANGKEPAAPYLTLVDDFAIAMLIYVREDILRLEASGAMKRLLKFPPVCDVHFLVQRALQIRKAHDARKVAAAAAAAAATLPATTPIGVVTGLPSTARGFGAAIAPPAPAPPVSVPVPVPIPVPVPPPAADSPPPVVWPPTVASHGANRAALLGHSTGSDAVGGSSAPFGIQEPLVIDAGEEGAAAPPSAPPQPPSSAAPPTPAQAPAPAPVSVSQSGIRPAGFDLPDATRRLTRALETLNTGLRREAREVASYLFSEGEQSVTFVVGSPAHTELLAALDELEAVRRALAAAPTAATETADM